MQQGFLRTVTFRDEAEPDWENYPFSIPAVRQLDGLEFDPKVTFIVGENGSGKSTIIEALAAVLGMNPEGGSKNLNFATRSTESRLHQALRPVRNARREKTESWHLFSEVEECCRGTRELQRACGTLGVVTKTRCLA
jgi:predicted ATPase